MNLIETYLKKNKIRKIMESHPSISRSGYHDSIQASRDLLREAFRINIPSERIYDNRPYRHDFERGEYNDRLERNYDERDYELRNRDYTRSIRPNRIYISRSSFIDGSSVMIGSRCTIRTRDGREFQLGECEVICHD